MVLTLYYEEQFNSHMEKPIGCLSCQWRVIALLCLRNQFWSPWSNNEIHDSNAKNKGYGYLFDRLFLDMKPIQTLSYLPLVWIVSKAHDAFCIRASPCASLIGITPTLTGFSVRFCCNSCHSACMLLVHSLKNLFRISRPVDR